MPAKFNKRLLTSLRDEFAWRAGWGNVVAQASKVSPFCTGAAEILSSFAASAWVRVCLGAAFRWRAVGFFDGSAYFLRLAEGTRKRAQVRRGLLRSLWSASFAPARLCLLSLRGSNKPGSERQSVHALLAGQQPQSAQRSRNAEAFLRHRTRPGYHLCLDVRRKFS